VYCGGRKKERRCIVFLENKESFATVNDDPNVVMKEYESNSNWWNEPLYKKMFEEDLRGVKESGNLVLLLPAGKSSHLEAGIAYGLGKRCIVVGAVPEAESLYFIFSEHFDSIEDFIAHIES
jgi:hypothetical protein